jgi:peptidoglycan/LPS O-acetylase OafA/YrhL
MARATFLRNRFARIYPATFVVGLTLLVLPVPGLGSSVIGVMLRVLLLQSWVPIGSVAYQGNGVTWSLSCEMAFYFALPFLIPLLVRIDRQRRLVFVTIYFLAATAFVAFVALKQPGVVWQNIAYSEPPVRFAEFFLGVVAALELKAGRRMGWPFGAALVIVSLVVLSLTRAYPLPDELLTPLYLTVIVLVAQRDIVRPSGWLASRWLVYAGEVSFCFYLVHQLVIQNVVHLVGHGGVAVALACLAVSLAAAAFVHHAVEIPCQRLVRGRVSASRSIATHPENVLRP